MTINYYDENAKSFFEGTVNADMSEMRNKFLSYVKGSKILDAGCGSGRDSKVFIDKGYSVTAMDASLEMVRLSSEYTGLNVKHMMFQEIDFVEEFDGIWASASLLHVGRSEMDEVLERLARALKKDGVLYASFKYGNFEGERNGRFFSYYDEVLIKELVDRHGVLEVLELARTEDVREGRDGEMWINVILRKN